MLRLARRGAPLRVAPRLALALALTGRGASAQVPEPSGALLLEVVLPPYRSGTIMARAEGTRLLLPVRAVLEVLDMAVRGAAPLYRFTRPLDGAEIVVDGITGALTEGRARRPLPAGMIERVDGDVLLERAEFERALGARLLFVAAALELRVLDADALPPVAAARRRREQARLLAIQSERPPPPQRLALERRWLDGGTLDYLVTLNDRRTADESSYLTTLGATVLGGALEAIYSGNFAGRGGDGSASWLGVWRERRWLAQMRVGDGMGTGALARPLRGLSITNAPFLRSLDYDAIPIRAAGDSAWEVESFVNGRLVRVDTLRRGDDAIPIAARYGANVIDLVARGPGGLERRESRYVALAATEFLRPGRVEYAASAGACRFGGCDAAANADVRIGLDRRLTARAGVDWQRDSLEPASAPGGTEGAARDVARPYAGLSWLALPSLTATGFAHAGSELSGVMRWQPTLNRSMQVERTSLSRRDPFGRTGGAAQERLSASAFWRPRWWREATFVSATWRGDHGDIGASERARLSVGARTRLGQIFPYVQRDRVERPGLATRDRSALGLSVYTTPSSRPGAWYLRLWGYLSTEWRNDGSRYVDLTLAHSAGSNFRAEASVAAGTGGGPRFGVRMYTDLPRARLITTAQRDGQGGYVGTHQLQGGVFLDPERGVVDLSRGPLLLRGALGGRVFLDLNANGTMDADEPPLAGVEIRVGAASTASDAEGWYRVWDVLPFEPVQLEVDRLSLESPLWVPAFERIESVPTPNSVRRVDVPVLAGGIVEGRLTRDGMADSVSGVAGVTLEFVRREGGTPVVVTTFSDGAFMALGLAPGAYTVRAGTVGRTLRGAPGFTVRSVADGDRVRDLILIVADPLPD